MNWRRHGRFLASLAVGLAAALALPMAPIDRTLAGGNLFFATYLLLAMRMAHHLTSADLRQHGQEDDEGASVIVLLAVGAVVLCLGAVVETMGARPVTGWLRPAMAIASVPLGWATLHRVMAFHYARLFYASEGAPGLDFPGTADPEPWDFIYFSLTMGMTAQTSDVAIRDTRLRRVAALHGALSFFFNTVLLALAVNLALSLG